MSRTAPYERKAIMIRIKPELVDWARKNLNLNSEVEALIEGKIDENIIDARLENEGRLAEVEKSLADAKLRGVQIKQEQLAELRKIRRDFFKPLEEEELKSTLKILSKHENNPFLLVQLAKIHSDLLIKKGLNYTPEKLISLLNTF